MEHPFTLDSEESQALEESKVLLGGPTNGKRKVSAALLSPPSTQGSLSSSTSASSASVRIRPFDPAAKAPIDLPQSDESVAALEFIGFTRKVAGDIYERWANRPDPPNNPDGFLQYALADLGRLNFQPLKDLPATHAMTGLGITDELQASLTDVQFSQLFRSQTLQYWLRDTMKIRYSSLTKLQERLKLCAIQTLAKKKEKRRPKIAGVFEPASSSSFTQLPLNVSVSSNISIEGNILPSTYVAIQSTPAALPDHYILYKGKAVGNMDEEAFVSEDGSINMLSVRTEVGGDFNPEMPAWYWSKELETAEQYRRWGEARCPWAATWIIQLQVPKAFIDSLRKEQLWYSPDWKEYVWYCRKSGSAGTLPAKFDKLWKAGRAQLIEGHICARAPAVIPRIKKEEVQEKILEDDAMQFAGRKASQSVFMNVEVVQRLALVVLGKVHIEIYPAVAPGV